MASRRHPGAALAAIVLVMACAPADALGARALLAADLAPIEAIAESEVRAGRIPGAVILIGTRDRVLYRRAFGHRTFKPAPAPMTPDTIFDLASVTKVVATATAIMQLVDRGRLALDDRVARHWPQFGANGKSGITVRDLLTHYSGLRPDLDLSEEWSGYDTAMKMIVMEAPVAPRGTRYLYSDINFEVLGELVRRLAGATLDAYCRKHIFGPLRMKGTGFLPAAALLDRIAPTQDLPGRVHWGGVHDATARWMGGVSGHAGLFATADDLAIYARMLLNGGRANGVRVLSKRSVGRMLARQSPPGAARARGLGWDRGGPDGYPVFPAGTYGHLGFTGTMVWIDPGAGLYAVVLTNRSYPDGKGRADPLRKAILELLSAAPRRSVEAAGGRGS